MYIVPGLDEVKIACITLKIRGIELFGFLLYTDTDHVLVNYMQDGIFELDRITGEKCAVFVIEPPSKRWFSYVKQKHHVWWDAYGTQIEKRSLLDRLSESIHNMRNKFSRISISDNNNCQIVIGNGNVIGLGNLMQEEYNTIFDRQEALSIAKHFGLGYSSLPCIVFFKELESNEIFTKHLGKHEDRESLKEYFRRFFDSKEFKDLLEGGGRKWN
ncbi:hypothetical protein [Priestia aryabhattai]|uniref:hypothetical protein n=1 Tax=Priestia aryabhattai TaxID=412384 RepID=UPI001C8DF289|nr:hypothetical protein [Priestia aryabhattai]MBY0062365.1 hypothetical protein [Priestia aryabhattai]